MAGLGPGGVCRLGSAGLGWVGDGLEKAELGREKTGLGSLEEDGLGLETGRVGFGLGFREGSAGAASWLWPPRLPLSLSSSPICPVGYACRPLELAGGGVEPEGAQTGCDVE